MSVCCFCDLAFRKGFAAAAGCFSRPMDTVNVAVHYKFETRGPMARAGTPHRAGRTAGRRLGGQDCLPPADRIGYVRFGKKTDRLESAGHLEQVGLGIPFISWNQCSLVR